MTCIALSQLPMYLPEPVYAEQALLFIYITTLEFIRLALSLLVYAFGTIADKSQSK